MARTQAGQMSSKQKKAQDAKRKVLVFSALAGSLTLTALLLQVLSPPPVRAQTSTSLFAADSSETIAQTIERSTRPWKSIYIHHSKTSDGDAQTITTGDLGDHFVICNGDGGMDGELQVGYRWDRQMPASAPRGSATVSRDCISICLVGDFDRMNPTPAQMRRLGQLVATLQAKHHIAAGQIVMVNQNNSPAGIGKRFPIQDFRQYVVANP